MQAVQPYDKRLKVISTGIGVLTVIYLFAVTNGLSSLR